MASKMKLYRKDTPHPRRRKEVKVRQSEILTPLIIDNIDVTPKALHKFDMKPQFHDMSFTTGESPSFTFSSIDLTKFRVDLLNQAKKLNFSSSFTTSFTDDFSFELSDFITRESFDSEAVSTTESQYQLVEERIDENEKMIKIPENIDLILKETETIFLLDMPSCTVVIDTDEDIDLIEDDGVRNRKVVDAEIQTQSNLKKSRHTDSLRITTCNVGVFVTNWKLYDDYNDNEGDLLIKRSNVNESTTNVDSWSTFSVATNAEERFLVKLANNRRFQDAVSIIERLLSNNYYNNEQKRFKCLLEEPPISCDNIDYKYRMNLLWTYKIDDVNGMAVVEIALNPHNEDLIAVGYGKHYFTDRVEIGYVLVWNIKNPIQPERKYRFNGPVMSLRFSGINPNLLAVGLYSGVLSVLDISQRYMNVLATSRQFFEPLWSIIWYKLPNEPDEYIMASFSNGYIIKFQLIDSQRLKHTELMRTCLMTGTVRGLSQLRACRNRISQYEKAQKLYKHPRNPYMYFVGTNCGNVFLCNTNYLNQYTRVARLHYAAINAVRSNPFLSNIYMSVGNDYWIRFWVEGIPAPFEESRIALADLNDATWSNSHSTIFITLRGRMINVWDLQRRIYSPQSQTHTPANLLNTRIEPTKSGNCYYIGDIDGNVYLYSLEDIPFPPFFQENALKQCLHKMLITQPDLLEKVKKIDTLRLKSDENIMFLDE